VRRRVSAVPSFDRELLGLARWVGERYVAPLATVLRRLAPPRTASEEGGPTPPPVPVGPAPDPGGPLAEYPGGPGLLGALRHARAAPASVVLRPGPDHEAAAAVETVGACLASGRRVIVVVPEASPTPATAEAIVSAFGQRVALFLGGSKRSRYRMWLDIRAGDFDVVVGTRSAVFAPLSALGLVWVARESHPAHREDRAPYYHVRDVALARTRRVGASCVLSALCPSVEAAELGLPQVAPARRRWPAVEVVRPGPEGRAPRLIKALAGARRAFLFSPVPGYGVAAVCRSCGEPARCAACGGILRSEEGAIRCVVCEASGRCARCGGSVFGLRRGGAERVEAWAGRAATARVRRLTSEDVPRLPDDGEILVGGPDDVRDLGPGELDLVGILDADRAARRPGLAARERALATWMEAVAWAFPSGRAIVQSSEASDPAIQALVRGKPDRFHAHESARRAEAGFPVGAAVFRVAGGDGLAEELGALEPITLLVTAEAGQTVCLVALDRARIPAFGELARALAASDVLTRVEAEPHL
jgi:primosomal protein N' (replication factor Y) (superfamily II helicase)